jgi:sugar lactone lactonase YvrE
MAATLFLAAMACAHPGSGIFVDAQGRVYFGDTGAGVWRLDAQGQLSLFHRRAYHWMAFDQKGAFAQAALGEWDNGSFERVTPPGAIPALILSSDYPVAVGHDGGIYYVPFRETGQREMIRRAPDGGRNVFAVLPADHSPKPMRWINGIAVAPDGTLFVSDNDAIYTIGRNGAVSTFRQSIQAPDCAVPLPDAPKLPYLRGLAVARDGTVYAAANGCRTVIAIPPQGPVRTVLKAEDPWSPTGLALDGGAIYVLEYLHTPGDDRREWTPRVRRVAADGTVTTLATVRRDGN